MIFRFPLVFFVFLIMTLASDMGNSVSCASTLEVQFSEIVRPFVETYCVECHGTETPKGEFDITSYSTFESIADGFDYWRLVLEKLNAFEMPPDHAKKHPAAVERDDVVGWIKTMLRIEADRNVGDPGPVYARRLNNAEYDGTIRDLTGVDIRPTLTFPIDPANEAGFDNSAESLTMSPALLDKYLGAARFVAEHLVLKPKGFVFAPHPVVTEPDRDKYCVKRIIEFYARQRTDYAEYFGTAWIYKNREVFGRPTTSLEELAKERGISSKYLHRIWNLLTEDMQSIGPIAVLQNLWRELPKADGTEMDAAQKGCEQMRDLVVALRKGLRIEFENLSVPGISNGSQPLVLWKDRQYATNRMRYLGGALEVQWNLDVASDVVSQSVAKALAVPLDELGKEVYEAGFARFCSVFPNEFFVSERGRVFLEESKRNRGRLLSAGFHLMVGYFRDDAPLCELMLDAKSKSELDALWQELDFITYAPMRQYKDYIFFERAEPPRFMEGREFDFARSEDKDSTSKENVERLAEVYLAKVRESGAGDSGIDAIQYYFRSISDSIRWVERTRLAAEPSHIETLQEFAERAYRRPLSVLERRGLLAFYYSLRESNGLSHEDAIRESVVTVLMSPNFSYRMDLADWGRARSPASP